MGAQPIPPLATNPDHAREWAESLFGELRGGILDVRLIDPLAAPDAGPCKRTPVEGIDAALRLALADDVGERGVYFGIATRAALDGGGTKENLAYAPALWVDVDDLTDAPARQAFLDDDSWKGVPKPSMIVNSGGGLHLYWLLQEPAPLTNEAERDAFEAIHRGLADILGGDRSAIDSTRILRVPGTINYPTREKRAKGRRVTLAEVFQPDNGERFSLADFEAFEDRGRNLTARRASIEYDAPIGAVNEPPKRVATLLHTWGKLSEAWGAGEYETADQSAVDIGVANLLAIREVSFEDIHAALRYRRILHGAKDKREDYYGLTVEKAAAWAQEERAKESPPTDTTRPKLRVVGADDGELFEPLALFDASSGVPYPVDTFPASFAAMIEGVAAETQTPPELAGGIALAVGSATVQRAFEVEAEPGWVEPLSLYTATVMGSGERKSAVVNKLTAPLTTYQNDYNAEGREARGAAQARVSRLEKEKNEVERALAKIGANFGRDTNDYTEAEARADAILGELLEATHAVPPPLRTFGADVTPEAMAAVLAEQGERFAIFSDEGAELFSLLVRYSATGEANQELLLKAHSGMPHSVFRKGSEPVELTNPALAVGIALQPEMMRAVRQRKETRGQGLLARFLFSLPESKIGTRARSAKPIPAAVRSHYAGVVSALLEHDRSGAALLEVDDHARRIHGDLHDEVEPQLGEDGPLAHKADWGSKLRGAAVRIAAVFHCIECAERNQHPTATRITGETMDRACTLARYYLDQAPGVLGAVASGEGDAAAFAVWGWILRHHAQPGATFTIREAQKGAASQTAGQTAPEIREALERLAVRGYVAELPAEPRAEGKPGRSPSPRWAVNPAAVAGSRRHRRD